MKNKRTCAIGHTYFKTSDCPVCPICEQECKPTAGFPAGLSAPARRALENNGIKSLEKLSRFSEMEILALHGMGPASIPIIKNNLKAAGSSFKKK